MNKHRSFIDTVYGHFNNRDYDAVEPYFAPDVETLTPGGTLKTRDEWRAMGEAFFSAVPDMHHEVVSYHEDGDTILVEGVYSGTQTGPLVTENGTLPASGTAFAFPYVDIFELRAGICVSHRIYWDNLGFMAQLGVAG
jgi:predicted ester cyclase